MRWKTAMQRRRYHSSEFTWYSAETIKLLLSYWSDRAIFNKLAGVRPTARARPNIGSNFAELFIDCQWRPLFTSIFSPCPSLSHALFLEAAAVHNNLIPFSDLIHVDGLFYGTNCMHSQLSFIGLTVAAISTRIRHSSNHSCLT